MNLHDVLVALICVNLMIGFIGVIDAAFSPVAVDPNVLPEAEYDAEGIYETDDELQDSTGDEFTYGLVVAEGKSGFSTFLSLMYGLPYLIYAMFGDIPAMNYLAWGLGVVFTFLYVWIGVELVRGVKLG